MGEDCGGSGEGMSGAKDIEGLHAVSELLASSLRRISSAVSKVYSRIALSDSAAGEMFGTSR